MQDARVEVADELELRLLALYARLRGAADVLFDAKAYLLVFGNGERAIVEIAHRLAAGEAAGEIRDLRGTAFSRLSKRDGKPQYLPLLPHIERRLARNLAHPLLEPLRLWYQTHLPRALGEGGSPSAEP